MLPIRDTIRSRSIPVVNWLLIVANLLVFLYEVSLSPYRLETFINTWGLSPASVNPLNPLTWFPYISHMFLHGGWYHFLSNMWILFIFGDNVEDRLGSLRYLIFYLLGGIAAGLAQALLSTDPQVVSIGASGAIAAVMGAYFMFFPHARIITLIPLWIIPWFVQIPALVFLGLWFVSQLFSGVLSLSTASGASLGGIAWWAHIGGFLFGLVLARVFAIGRPDPTWHRDQYYPY